MKVTGIFDAKRNFSALIDEVEAGEEVRITRHGKEVVRMLPMRRTPVITAEQIQRELAAIHDLHRRVKPGPGWRELNGEGRE